MKTFYFLAILISLIYTHESASLTIKNESLERAKHILENNILIDGHNDLAYTIRLNFKNRFSEFDFKDILAIKNRLNGTDYITHTDEKRLKEGKVGGQFWAIYASCNSLAKDATRIHMEQIDTILRLIAKYPDVLQFAASTEDVMNAFKNKKIASLLGMESGHAIDSSLAILRVFYELGIRYMTLTHNCNLPWATNHLIDRQANASLYGGLTDFGRKVIREMNRLGMIVDLSHTSHQTMIDALDETKAPVMFSHSSVFAVCNQTRNVRDDILLKLKENKGVIMINFYNVFLSCENNTTIEKAIEHINYVKDKIGVNHVGIGGDFDGIELSPDDLEDVSKYPNLFAALLERGWSEEELIKLAGGNILRVFKGVEEVSKRLKYLQPIEDLIVQADLGEGFKNCRTSF